MPQPHAFPALRAIGALRRKEPPSTAWIAHARSAFSPSAQPARLAQPLNLTYRRIA